MACRKIIINQDHHSWSQEWQMIELWPKPAIYLSPKIIGHTWYVGDGSAGSTALLQSCVYICILINMNCFGPGSTWGFSGTFRSQFWHWFCTNRLWHSQTLQKKSSNEIDNLLSVHLLNFWWGTIPILRQQRNWVGGVRKMTIFADVQYYLCWRRVSGWVRKSLKICWRNIGMVPSQAMIGGYLDLYIQGRSKQSDNLWVKGLSLNYVSAHVGLPSWSAKCWLNK